MPENWDQYINQGPENWDAYSSPKVDNWDQYAQPEDTRSFWEKLLAATGSGLLEGAASIPEAVGKLSAIPSRLAGAEPTGTQYGWDAPYELAKKIRAEEPAVPEGLGYKVLAGLAQAPGQAAKYAAALAGGGPLGIAAIMGAQAAGEAYGGGADVSKALGEGLVTGATGGILGKLGAQPLASRLFYGALTGAGGAALEGGNAQDIAAGALSTGLLGAAFKTPAEEAKIPLTKNIKAELEKKITGEVPVSLPTEMSRGQVEAALINGEPVRPEVLNQYPDLAARKAATDPMITGKPGTPPTPENAVNFQRYQLPDEAKYTIADQIQANKTMVEQKQEPVTWEQIHQRAQQLGLTVEDLARTQRSPIDAAARVDTIREHVATFADRRVALNQQLDEAISTGQSPNVIQALRDDIRATVAEQGHALATTLDMSHESGLMLNAWKIMSRPTTEGEAILRKLARSGKMTTEVLDKLSALPPEDVHGQLDIMRAAFKPKLSQYLYEIWINGLLSSPVTHAVNLTSNIVTQAVNAAERPISAALELRKGANRERYFGEVAADIGGFIHSLPSAMVAFNEAARGNAVSHTKIEHPGALAATYGGVPTPTTMLVAADEAAKAIAAGREAFVQAYRQGRMAGQTTAEAYGNIKTVLGDLSQSKNILKDMRAVNETNRIKKMTGQPVDDLSGLIGEALKAAEYQTFTTEGGPGVKAAIGLKDSGSGLGWVLRLVAPFIQTPTNIAKVAYEHTPAELINIGRNQAKMSSGQVSDALAKVAFGSTVGALSALMAADGTITGGGPTDPTEKQNWLAQGKQPYSLKLGDRYYSFQRIEPLATLAGLAADFVNMKDQNQQQSQVKNILQVISDNFTDKTFMQGIENLALAWSDPGRYGERVTKSLVGSVIPTGVAAAARAIDPTLRDTPMKNLDTALPDAMRVLQSRIPLASQSLPEKVDVTGVPTERSTAGLGPAVDIAMRMASPVQVSQTKPQADLQREFETIGYFPRQAKRTMNLKTLRGDVTVDLTRDEIKQLDTANLAAADEIRTLMSDPQWAATEPVFRAKIIKSIYQKFRSVPLSQIRGGRLLAYDYEEAQ